MVRTALPNGSRKSLRVQKTLWTPLGGPNPPRRLQNGVEKGAMRSQHGFNIEQEVPKWTGCDEGRGNAQSCPHFCAPAAQIVRVGVGLARTLHAHGGLAHTFAGDKGIANPWVLMCVAFIYVICRARGIALHSTSASHGAVCKATSGNGGRIEGYGGDVRPTAMQGCTRSGLSVSQGLGYLGSGKNWNWMLLVHISSGSGPGGRLGAHAGFADISLSRRSDPRGPEVL